MSSLPNGGPGGHVVLIDGECGLCLAAQAWASKRGGSDIFQFYDLGSPAGQAWLGRVGLPLDLRDTMVLVEGEKPYFRSTAALRIARRLRFPWRMLYAMILVPRPLRDAMYRFVARRRHRWGTCALPT